MHRHTETTHPRCFHAERVLFFDIETSPIIGYTWSTWETNVVEVIREWQILSFAFKWEGGKTKVYSIRTHKAEKRLLKELWKLFDEADVLVAHNGDSFDIRKSRSRFLAYGFPPPSPYKTIDTLKYARKIGAFTSNKLNDLGIFLGVGGKVKTGGFELWKGCMDNKRASWLKMEEYNKRDVDLLYKVFWKLHKWIPRSSKKRLNVV